MAEFKLGRIKFVWKNEWDSSTIYYVDDVVRYGGKTYICVVGHTSNTNFYTDLTAVKWHLIADGQEWKGNWAGSTYYKVGDIVKWGSLVYICNTGHTSQTYLEDDQAKWDTFATTSFDWKGNWAGSTYYKLGDVVRYGGTIYRCKTSHTSQTLLEDDQSKWDIVIQSFEYKSTWAGSTYYKINDVVKYGGGLWICTTQHTSTTSLAVDEANWAQFVEGLEFEDSWDQDTRYQPGDIVTFGGYQYVSKTNNLNAKPTTNASDWDLFSTGFNFIGEWGADSTDQDYRVGDLVTLGGYTYLCVQEHESAAQKPGDTANYPTWTNYWERLNPGFLWRGNWADATVYELGDVVRYGDNTYAAVTTHTSDEVTLQNRPDQDVDGSEWNLLAAGSSVATLTTDGDLVYYSGAGPTRLPIGNEGEVLVIKNNNLTWDRWGDLHNVFYVAPDGTDAATYGYTIDRPFKTVRYATEQIQKGAVRPNSTYLLEINKAFMQEEVVEWVNAQVSGGAGIWSGFIVDDEAKCRRDTGQIIDALIWDLGHGGNERTRAAALTYFDGGALIAAIADEDEQLVASLEYLEEVIDAVLSNVAPAATYSSFTQTTNSDYVEETDAQTTVASLLDIITDSVTAGSDANIPVKIEPQNSLFVKTGIYKEVLPIIVPKNTAIIGDELRSTRIEPAGALVSISDTPYSLAGILNLESNLNALLSGDNDGPGLSDGLSSFSGESVDTTLTIADSTVALEAAELARQIHDYIDFGVNGASGDSTTPLISGSNTPNTTIEYTYAVEILEKNRTYLVEEVIGYIAATYPSYSYDAAKCRRDVNRYIDAIKHDLIYTGNYKSLLAARYYVNAVNNSLQEDMFYLRNGTGLRNCTLQGLTGTLGAANVYGTKRPSAGAFTSLDPGWGPNHQDAWISNKSPYVQNVTNFGTACVGLKVDGDLHAGGNDSIVANDYTQIISDGIGCWVTNLGRSELVSVFSYYGHIGYLAENGGKIRATNGNSSYGEYGTVAEGVDVTETPVIGTVNNRAYEATIGYVFTDGDEVLGVEYDNAGNAYTTENNTYTFTSGTGIDVTGDEIRDNGVFEVRMLTAGADYNFAESNAQTGNTTSITLSATDTDGSLDYVGMALYIKSGKGVGQYGYITSYDSGTKIAQISAPSTGSAGWDHVVPGTAIQSSLDLTSLYTIEPRATFSSPTFSETVTTLTGNSTWKTPAFYDDTFITVSSTSTGINKSTDGGQTWSSSTAATSTRGAIAVGDISGTTYWVTIPYGPGGASDAGEYSNDGGTTWNAMTLPSSNNWIDVAFSGDTFMAIAQGGDVAISTNGTSWTAATAIAGVSGANYTAVDYGAGKWVIASSDTAGDPMYYSDDDGTTWSACTTPTGAYNDIAFGNNIWVIVGVSGALAYSIDGITFTDNLNGAGTDTNFSVSYGQGLFVLSSVDTGAYEAYTSENGLTWTQRTLTDTSVDYNFAFGSHSTQGPTWVGVADGGTGSLYFPNIRTAQGRAQSTSDGQLAKVRITEPGSGYTSAPTLTITDPLNTEDATYTVRIGDGVLAQPTFNARGTGYTTSTATVTGDGYEDKYQPGNFVNVAGLTDVPAAGSNVIFNDDGVVYKLVTVTELLGAGPYTARLQVSPDIPIADAPEHEESLSIRIRYSQVRLTGHDFLDIGTGNFASTNYPGDPAIAPDQADETLESGGGRVFFTSTDQDGNFRVGDLFSVEQATGSSTLNADAFNLSGLQELQLGAVTLGSSNTAISEFSTDGTFAADSDNIVPTQRAIKTYLESQIGGGGSSLNVNKLTAGSVEIFSNQITSTDNVPININTKVNFTGGVDGAVLALNYFLLR